MAIMTLNCAVYIYLQTFALAADKQYSGRRSRKMSVLLGIWNSQDALHAGGWVLFPYKFTANFDGRNVEPFVHLLSVIQGSATARLLGKYTQAFRRKIPPRKDCSLNILSVNQLHFALVLVNPTDELRDLLRNNNHLLHDLLSNWESSFLLMFLCGM